MHLFSSLTDQSQKDLEYLISKNMRPIISRKYDNLKEELLKITSFLSQASWSQRAYHIIHNISEHPVCPVCKKNPLYWDGVNHYRKTCSKKCNIKYHSKISKSAILNDNDENILKSLFNKKHWTALRKHKELRDKLFNATSHITTKHLDERIWLYFNQEPPWCQYCHKYQVEWHPIKKRFQKHCSNSCANKHSETKQKKIFNLKKKYGVTHISQINRSQQDINLISNNKWLKETYIKGGIDLIQQHVNYSTDAIRVRLRKLNFPEYNSTGSEFEKQIKNYILSLGIPINEIKHCDRSIISPKEIDLYFPNYKFAIECNGNKWHSEKSGKLHPKYHLNKTLKCNEHDIHLLHIWENNWVFKKEIIKSILSSKFKKNKKIYARKTQIKELPNTVIKDFYNQNHIQGHVNSSINLGLYHDDALVAGMSFSKNRFSKKYQWEMTRFCNILYHNVIGAGGKLMNSFINDLKPKSIVSFSDLSRNTGNLYQKIGFTKERSSPPTYFYTADYKMFFSRMQFQKHKLKNKLDVFDPKLTEWENMQINGYDRIWDCGNDVWVWRDQ